jgi:hypothetical protein
LHALSKFLSIAKNSIEVISTTIDLLIVSFMKIGQEEAILYRKIFTDVSAYPAHTLSDFCGAGPRYPFIMLLTILELHVVRRWQGSSLLMVFFNYRRPW